MVSESWNRTSHKNEGSGVPSLKKPPLLPHDFRNGKLFYLALYYIGSKAIRGRKPGQQMCKYDRESLSKGVWGDSLVP